MASFGVAALLIVAVAVLGTASVSRDQCSATRYCPDGYLCCFDKLHCCPIGYQCCYNYTKCCLKVIKSAMNSTVSSYFDESNEITPSGQENVMTGDVDDADQRGYQRLQEILRKVFPRLHEARREGNMNRPLGNNSVIVVYN